MQAMRLKRPQVTLFRPYDENAVTLQFKLAHIAQKQIGLGTEPPKGHLFLFELSARNRTLVLEVELDRIYEFHENGCQAAANRNALAVTR